MLVSLVNQTETDLIRQRNAALRATEAHIDSPEALRTAGSHYGFVSSEAEESSSEPLPLETPVVRFLISDSEKTQEVPLQANVRISKYPWQPRAGSRDHKIPAEPVKICIHHVQSS